MISSQLPGIRDTLEMAHQRAIKMVKGLKHLSCDERLKRVGAVQPGEREGLI